MKCCCCINLRTGAVVIGILDILAGLMCVNYSMMGVFHSRIYVFPSISVLYFLSGGFLLGGTINRNHDMLFIKLFFSMVILVATIIYCIALMAQFSNATMGVREMFAGLFAVELAGLFLTISIKTYFWVVVLVFYRSFTQERIIDMENAYTPLELHESIVKDNVVTKNVA